MLRPHALAASAILVLYLALPATIAAPQSGGTGPAGIDPADIIGWVRADVPFAQQSGFEIQVLNTYPAVSAISETDGVSGPDGDMRFGKVPDPANPGRTVLLFQVKPGDVQTSGGQRVEAAFPSNIEMDKVYWAALSVYVYDWGKINDTDGESLYGVQLHSGNNNLGLGPSFTIGQFGVDGYRLMANHSTSQSPRGTDQVVTFFPPLSQPPDTITFGLWTDFVFKFRQSLSARNGFLQIWKDGAQVVDYHGRLGFDTPGFKDYLKFGYYNYALGDRILINSNRKLLLRSPVSVIDPTPSGTKYTAEQLRRFVNRH